LTNTNTAALVAASLEFEYRKTSSQTRRGFAIVSTGMLNAITSLESFHPIAENWPRELGVTS
jgi:hypothetical protein